MPAWLHLTFTQQKARFCGLFVQSERGTSVRKDYCTVKEVSRESLPDAVLMVVITR